MNKLATKTFFTPLKLSRPRRKSTETKTRSSVVVSWNGRKMNLAKIKFKLDPNKQLRQTAKSTFSHLQGKIKKTESAKTPTKGLWKRTRDAKAFSKKLNTSTSTSESRHSIAESIWLGVNKWASNLNNEGADSTADWSFGKTWLLTLRVRNLRREEPSSDEK